MAEISPHSIRHRCNAFHAHARLLKKCGGSRGNRPGAYRRLQIPVQVLIGIEFGCIRREVEQLDLIGVLRDPLAHAVGTMHAQVVDDQEHLALGVLNQILQEDDEALGIDGALEEGETHQSLVGNRRDHRCRSMATGRQPKFGRQACHRVAPNPVRVLANGGLVTPVDLGILSLCACHDLRILVPEPRLEAGRILLERTFDRPLRREAPAPQVLAHGADGHVDTEEMLDGKHHRTAIPQCEFELELGGVRTDDLQAQLLLLNQRQRSSRSVPAAALPALDHRIDAIGLRAPRPFEDSPDMNATDFGNVSPRVTLFAKHKRLPTDVFEGFGRELSGVDFFHARIISISI